MIDVAQELEDILEELVGVQKTVNKLTTASVSGAPVRKRMKEIHRRWLPISGVLEKGNLVDAAHLKGISEQWNRLMKLVDGKNPKSQYKPVLKSIVSTLAGC